MPRGRPPRLETLEDRRLLSAASPGFVLSPGVRPDNVAGDIVCSAEAYYNEVSADYQHYFGRAPDAQGMAFWVGRRTAGMTAEQLEAALVSSDEFRGHEGRLIDPGFLGPYAKELAIGQANWVRSVFQDMLGRPATDAEVANAMAQLQQRNDYFAVASELANCPEHEARLVTSYYQQFLGRAPTQAEVQGWIDRIAKGQATQEEVKAQFLLSDEYIQTHTASYYKAQHVPDPGAVYSYWNDLVFRPGTGDEYLRQHGGDSVDWLFGAYHDVLGRQPEVTGLNAWLNSLGTGTTASEGAGMSGLTNLS
jgi:hypothetical protein